MCISIIMKWFPYVVESLSESLDELESVDVEPLEVLEEEEDDEDEEDSAGLIAARANRMPVSSGTSESWLLELSLSCAAWGTGNWPTASTGELDAATAKSGLAGARFAAGLGPRGFGLGFGFA